MAARRSRVPLLLVLAFIFMGLPSLVEFYTDWLWFGELGYQHVFTRALSTKTGIAAVVFVLASGFDPRQPPDRLPLHDAPGDRHGHARRPARARRRARPVAVARVRRRHVRRPRALRLRRLALGRVADVRYATPFNQADPILGYDVSFYLFTLPVLQIARSLLLMTLLPTIIGTAVVYAASGRVGLSPTRGLLRGSAGDHASRATRLRHLPDVRGRRLARNSIAPHLGVRLPERRVVYRRPRAHAGNARADRRGPGRRRARDRAGAAARSSGRSRRRSRCISWCRSAASLYATAIQRFVVAPNEQVKETPFIVHNIAATRARVRA